jgi:hypothetical protein
MELHSNLAAGHVLAWFQPLCVVGDILLRWWLVDPARSI